MTNSATDQLFRQAAEAEGGTPVSAGARMAHIRAALASGRAVYVDLSGIPEQKRPALVAEIKELVNRASDSGQQHNVNKSAPDSSTPVR